MDAHDLPVKLTTTYYYSIMLIHMFVVLLIIFLWRLWNTRKRYSGLPTYYGILFEMVYEYLTNNSKKVPFKSVMFQKVDAACKRFEKEGIFVTWCFRPAVFIYGDKITKTFVTNEASADKPSNYEILKEGFGEGLVVSNGETWKKDRKMLDPLFKLGMLKNFVPIFNGNAKKMVKTLSEIANKPNIDLVPYLRSCAFTNVCESIFNINMEEKGSEIEIQNFFDVVEELQDFVTSRWILPHLIAKMTKYCTPSGWKYLKLYSKGKKISEKIISNVTDSRKLLHLEKRLDSNKKTLASILLEQHLKDPSFTLKQFKDHINTFAVAGFDTVVYTMLWCLFLLGLHKDVQQNIYDEVKSAEEEFIGYEDLGRFEYLECVIKETLRLYPTVPGFARYLKKDIDCGEYKIPKNTTVCIYLYRLHRNPEIFPDPERFDPERFRKSENSLNRKWSHLPFSEGYRNCIGKRFAMMQMKVNLAYILRNYKVTSSDKVEDIDLNWNILLSPTKPLRMLLTPRQTVSSYPCETKQ